MEEIWKDVVGYEGLYQVSNLGQVKSLRKNIILKQNLNQNGYPRVVLNNRGRKVCNVHRLVAIAFIPNPNEKPEVNHIDNNPQNSRVDNLEWVTHKENMEWCAKQGRKKTTSETRKRMKRTRIKDRKPVIGTDKNGTKYVFCKLEDVEILGFDSKNVSKCCKGKAKTVKGFTWEFLSSVPTIQLR